jgi:phosphoribosyl 1,2-cyclic phosphate phosphodiesterase
MVRFLICYISLSSQGHSKIHCLKITFLGTGASHGIPVIGCKCKVCYSENSKDVRLRSSIFIETDKLKLVIDAGPDFRQQMLREKITHIDAVLLTHEHKDHTAGLDDVRAFNYLMKKPMSIYADFKVLDSVKQDYSYAFSDDRYPGAPEMDLHPISNQLFEINSEQIMPIQVFHHLLPVFGFRVNNMAYVTDAKTIPASEKEKLHNLDLLVLNALRVQPHIAHMGLDEVLDLVAELKPKQTFLTHISHMQHGFDKLSEMLPSHIQPAYDGFILEV